MQNTEMIGPVRIMGLKVRTRNDGRAAIDLKHLWDRFFSEDIPGKIPGKTSNAIYAVYTDYESDHTGEYSTILGCSVEKNAGVPESLTSIDLAGGVYKHVTVKGSLPEVVINAWTDIWNDRELKRAFTADFEVYDPASFGSDNAAVDIYIAVSAG